MDKKIVYSADLLGNTLVVYENYCEISKKGAFNRWLGTKKIYYKDITSIQYKGIGDFGGAAGYIQFEYPGANETNKPPLNSQNAVVFNVKRDLALMKTIYKYIDQRIYDEKMRVVSSPADEIKKFKELLDQNIITQEEFDAKKKQLLGL